MQELVCDRIFGNHDGVFGADDIMCLGVTEHGSVVGYDSPCRYSACPIRPCVA